jgi:hypothetical protein
MTRFDEERLSDLRSLRAIFLVPDNGSPVHDTMTHIAALAQRDRLWFERCEVVGEKVLAPHEHSTDGKPAALTIPALRRRFGCDAQAAFEYGELLLALDATAHVIAAYAVRVDREGMEAVCRELRDLVVELDLVEGGEDPVEEGEDVLADEGSDEAEDVEAEVDAPAVSTVGYHVVGSIFEVEEDQEPWEAGEPEWYQALLKRIMQAPTQETLSALAEEIRSTTLTRDQAGVAWTAWRIRRERVASCLPLGRTARGVLARIKAANGNGRDLGRLGSWLYRAQRRDALRLAPHEWRAIWSAYRSRRNAQATEGRGA